jgi:hypothetical protein
MSLADTRRRELGDNEMRFVSREKPNPIDWSNFDPEIKWSDETEVIVLRASLFFHSEQKITLGKLREFFTPKAIKLLEKDGYVKLNIDHGENS